MPGPVHQEVRGVKAGKEVMRRIVPCVLLQCGSLRLLASDCMLGDAVLTMVLLHPSLKIQMSPERNPRDRDQNQDHHKTWTPTTNHFLEPVSTCACNVSGDCPIASAKGNQRCDLNESRRVCKGQFLACMPQKSPHVHVDTTRKLTR